MKTDKRVEKNKNNILNLKSLLIEVCKKPSNFSEDFLSCLKSQNGLSKIESVEKNIEKSSINTLKRISPKILDGGFDELDKLRVLAYETLLKEKSKDEKSNKINRLGLLARVKELEEELDSSRKNQLMSNKIIIDSLKSFKSIKETEQLPLIKEMSENSIKKINTFALSSSEAMSTLDSVTPIRSIK
jgi:hypothetical protein